MGSIKNELTKGVFWIAVAKYSGVIVSLVITAILARNVSPAAFGTMAIATVIMAFLDIFSDMGLGVAIIQFKDLTKQNIRSLFSISVLLALGLTFILFFSAVPIAHFYKDSTLIPVIRWLCVCLFFKALNIIPNGLMLKNKRFKEIAVRTLLFQFLSGGVACWLAVKGWGIYALLISPIISAIGVFGYNFFTYPQCPIWPIDMEVVKRIWSYSMYQFLFSFINYFSRNADKLIIGKFLSMKDLGYYDKSYRLMQMPLQNITFVITPVLHPILSSLQDEKEELSSKNIKLSVILAQISFPLGILLYFCASPIIIIIFGKSWIPAIPVFQILALSVPLQVILSTSGSLFQAAGMTKHLFLCGLQSASCTVGAFIIAGAVFKTIGAMAWAWDIALLITFIYTYWFMYKYTFRTDSFKFYRSLIPQIINSAVTVMIVLLALKLWTPIEPFIQIIWMMMSVAVPTVIMAHILKQYSILSLITNVMKKFNN